jgi:hypothetical protein
MSFVQTGFSWNSKSNEEVGVMLVHEDSSSIKQAFGITSKQVREKIRYRDIPVSYGVEKETSTMPISITKIDGSEFTYEDRVELARFFRPDNNFHEFWSYDYGDRHIFYLYFNSGSFENFFSDKGIITLEAEMLAPYAFSPVSHEVYDLFNNTTSTIIEVENKSNVIEFYYPKIEFTLLDTATSFKIINHTNGGQVFEFTGLQTGETVSIDNLARRIKSSTGLPRLSDFNKNWFNLWYGVNTIEVFGKCILEIKSQFPMMI